MESFVLLHLWLAPMYEYMIIFNQFLSFSRMSQFLKFLIFSSSLQPRIDNKHPRWLHLRIRPSNLPFVDPAKSGALVKLKTKSLVDGRWTLAFRDEESCKSALSMILDEIDLQCNEVERRLKPLVDLENTVDPSNPSSCPPQSSYTTPSSSSSP